MSLDLLTQTSALNKIDAPIAKRLRRVLSSELAFATLLSAALVGLRILLFDFHFFKAHMLPNHDMSQGVSFFATNMHSLRLSGELAWWNPAAANGYAQYFQSFLSPLAPTPNNLAFIVWSEMIALLGVVHIKLPEYGQYIAYTYLLAPFLTFVAGTLFLRQLFEKRSIVSLLMIAYVFSSIGIWNSAWFYFQEQFMLFAVLGTAIAFCRKPNLTTLFLFLAAVLVQVCSASYWTVHNSWFYVIVAGSYAFAYPQQIKRAVQRIGEYARIDKRKTTIVVAMLALTTALWSISLGSMVTEQSKKHIRSSIGSGQYSVHKVLDRVHELRRSTIEFFNPSLDKVLASYQFENDVHNARYVGLVFLPFLFLLPLYAWRRKERFLACVTLSTLLIVIGFPLLALLWAATPMLATDQHLFYFYSQYLQLALIMAAAAALETSVGKGTSQPAVRRMTSVTLFVVAVSFLALAGYNLFSSHFPSNDVNLQTALYSFTILLVVGILSAQNLLSSKETSRRMLLGALVIVALLDLTTYFVHVNDKDAAFSNAYLLSKRYRMQTHEPAYAAIRAAVAEPRLTAREISLHRAVINRPWADPDPHMGFTGALFANMPIFTDFWPINRFLKPRGVVDLQRAPVAVQDYEYASAPIQLVQSFDTRWDTIAPDNVEVKNDIPELDEVPEAGLAHHDAGSLIKDRLVPGFNYQFQSWTYNGFKIALDAPQSGKLIIHQLPDPLWQVKLDNSVITASAARCVDMTVPISQGKHELQMDYMPLARRLYWPSAVLLQLTVAMLLFAALKSRKRSRQCV